MSEAQRKLKRTGFYPASARDYLEPLQLLTDWVDHLIFCDIRDVPQGRSALRELAATIEDQGLPEASFFLGDALSAISCLKPVDVFFLRNDSGGEGGSALFLLGPKRLPLALSLITPGGILITDQRNGFDWLPGLVSGEDVDYRVGDRLMTFNESQPWTEHGLFAMKVA